MAIRVGTLIAELSPAGTGINAAVRGIVRMHDGEAEAFVKRLSDTREILVEIVAARLANALGLPVPEPLLVYVPPAMGGPALAFGSRAIGEPNLATLLTGTGASTILTRLRAWKHLLRAACFDEWIANCDRHPGNVLYGGREEFWLIDHGLSIHMALPVDQLAPHNQLFGLAVEGLPEGDLLSLRPKALGLMEDYRSEDVSLQKSEIPPQVWSDEQLASVFDWLSGRQNHLLRFADERIPAKQQEIFRGHSA